MLKTNNSRFIHGEQYYMLIILRAFQVQVYYYNSDELHIFNIKIMFKFLGFELDEFDTIGSEFVQAS